MQLITTLILTMLTAFFLGCGSGSSSNNTKAITAQLVDSPIAGVSYTCQDGTSGTTDHNGMFTCNSAPVTFNIGNLQLGVVDPIPSDNLIFPEDLLGIDRGSYNSNILLALIRLLQSMDDDGDVSETITIPSNMAEKMNACYNDTERFHLNTSANIDIKLNEYIICADVPLIDAQTALDNLKNYYNSHISSTNSSSSISSDNGGGFMSSQNNSSTAQSSSISPSSSANYSSASEENLDTWNIDITYNGRAYSNTWHYNNVKIASITDTIKTQWNDSYPFPYIGSYGDSGKVLVDTSFYNSDDSDGLILSYYSEDYGVNNDAIFIQKGYCLDMSWLNDIVTDHGDTSFACSNKEYTGSWDIINTSLQENQVEALLSHKTFTFHDTGKWINNNGESSLNITFTPVR